MLDPSPSPIVVLEPFAPRALSPCIVKNDLAYMTVLQAHQSGAFTVVCHNSNSILLVNRLTANFASPSSGDKNCVSNSSVDIGSPILKCQHRPGDQRLTVQPSDSYTLPCRHMQCRRARRRPFSRFWAQHFRACPSGSAHTPWPPSSYRLSKGSCAVRSGTCPLERRRRTRLWPELVHELGTTRIGHPRTDLRMCRGITSGCSCSSCQQLSNQLHPRT
jgi:hypothetical protein